MIYPNGFYVGGEERTLGDIIAYVNAKGIDPQSVRLQPSFVWFIA